MAGDNTQTGHCLCGKVSVTATLKNHNVDACHCEICRRWSGGPMLAVACDGEPAFSGESHIGVFDSSDWAQRGFCKECGTHLFYRLKEGGFYALPVGLLDSADGWTLHAQVFIDEKPGFYAFSQRTAELTGAELFAQLDKSS
ncbi:GFA family protein [Marinobacterium sp. YM272]|uniref:GFA family protein n=1 Tax=Marinobacterium sp. YM272 TaxID=3421654 RepID=UPI003D7F8CB4